MYMRGRKILLEEVAEVYLLGQLGREGFSSCIALSTFIFFLEDPSQHSGSIQVFTRKSLLSVNDTGGKCSTSIALIMNLFHCVVMVCLCIDITGPSALRKDPCLSSWCLHS